MPKIHRIYQSGIFVKHTICFLCAMQIAVCSGIKNARQLVEEVKAGRANYDFVEVCWQTGSGRGV